MQYRQRQATWVGVMFLATIISVVPLRGTAGGATVKLVQQPLHRGVILVANESLRDPRFARSVILITDHSEDGAAGVILNRPTMVRVVDAIPMLGEHLNRPDKIMYFGGPVGADSAQVLVSARQPIEGATRIIDGVYAVYRMSNLVQHFVDETFAPRTRFYGGYAGWGPRQLEAEIKRRDWAVIDGDANTVFSDAVENLWKDLHGKFSGLWVRLPTIEGPRRLDAAQTILSQARRLTDVCEGRHDSATTMAYRNSTDI